MQEWGQDGGHRLLHCTAYGRLGRKIQVFFATENDRMCTRMEHMNHVAAISGTISVALGLNTELVRASALGIVRESANLTFKLHDSCIGLT